MINRAFNFNKIVLLLCLFALCSCVSYERLNYIIEGEYFAIDKSDNKEYQLEITEIEYDSFVERQNENVVKEACFNSPTYYNISLFLIKENDTKETFYTFKNLKEDSKSKYNSLYAWYSDDNGSIVKPITSNGEAHSVKSPEESYYEVTIKNDSKETILSLCFYSKDKLNELS